MNTNLACRDKNWLNIIIPKAIKYISNACITDSISIKGSGLNCYSSFGRDSRNKATTLNCLA